MTSIEATISAETFASNHECSPALSSAAPVRCAQVATVEIGTSVVVLPWEWVVYRTAKNPSLASFASKSAAEMPESMSRPTALMVSTFSVERCPGSWSHSMIARPSFSPTA